MKYVPISKSIPAIIILLIGCSLFSCKKTAKTTAKTTATYDFYYTGTTTVGSKIHFFSTAPVTSSFLWTFGDGSTSTDSVPDHIYTTSDSFMVALVVDGGGPVSKHVTIGKSYLHLVSGTRHCHGTYQINMTYPYVYDTSYSIADSIAFYWIDSSTVAFGISGVFDTLTIRSANDTLSEYFAHFPGLSWWTLDYFNATGNISLKYYHDIDPVDNESKSYYYP
jgi:PKD repeat protein